MSITIRTRLLALAFVLAPLSAFAEMYVVPADHWLVHDSDAIVIGTVTAIGSELNQEQEIVTNIDVDVEFTLKGGPASVDQLRIVEPGGIVGERATIVSAAPRYWINNRALIFLTRMEDGTWRTWGAALGKFDFVTDVQSRQLAVRWALQDDDVRLWDGQGRPHEEGVRHAARFIDWVERAVQKHVAAQSPHDPESEEQRAPADYVVDPPSGPTSSPEGWEVTTTATYPPSAYTQGTFRWEVFDEGGSVGYRISGSQPGYDSTGTAQRATAAWTNDSGSNVRLSIAGTTTAGFVEDGISAIVYNSASGVPAGALAYARWYANATHTYKGETFYSIDEGDVVMKQNPGVSQKVFDEAITHEIGHTLGFRHSDQGTPSSTQAVMKAVLSGSYGATLGPWDIEAVRTVYESTTTTPPARPRFTFSEDPLVAGVTVIKALHLTELRNAINSLRQAAGLAAVSWTDPSPRGVTVKAVHINEMRSALTPALAYYGITATYAQTVSRGTLIRASHFQELRNYLK